MHAPITEIFGDALFNRVEKKPWMFLGGITIYSDITF
jgi:hypothetical protein